MGDLFASYMVEEEILEHNLYGVDINEDAVEIAKLSLWLRTAKRGRPLTKLVDKIKCGNSLIDDKSVVSNAFVWEEEFKEVLETKGGFLAAHWDGTAETEEKIKELTKATIRCIPFDSFVPGDKEPGKCMVTGKPSACRVIFARSY